MSKYLDFYSHAQDQAIPDPITRLGQRYRKVYWYARDRDQVPDHGVFKPSSSALPPADFITIANARSLHTLPREVTPSGTDCYFLSDVCARRESDPL